MASYAVARDRDRTRAPRAFAHRPAGQVVLSGRRHAEQPEDVLAAVLELAVIVAQAGLRTVPPLDPPVPLKPFLGFTHRVPGPALRAARRVLDDDPDYRERVLVVATDELVGEAGMQFLKRPEGWDARIEELRAQRSPADEDPGTSRNQRQLERRLSGAEAALVRSEEALAKVRAELAASQAALTDERRQRARLASEVEQLTARLGASEAEVDRVRLQLRASLEDARQASSLLADQAAELEVLRTDAVRRGALDDALAETAAAVDRVAATLRDIRSGDGFGHSGRSAPGDDQRGTSRGATLPKWVRLARPPGRRSPIPLPGGVFDDSPEAADHLLRTEGVLLLVDGYNVAKWKWADVAPADLRQRLLAMVSQVAQRTGARAHIVFDGAFTEAVSAVAGGSARVRVSFTTADVEADDAILELVAAAPPEQPVVVVSSDRRVRDGAIALGVNAVPTPAFVAACASATR
jgi:hypothetical protein